ncbi:NfeD family protein [Micromonospora sp. b486]|uniref:NfeD family protein n=1 Tax=Micromonospora sp. b486 TaxID=3053986 RepID=UPI00259C8666|nr:NfeD family protein [Micromonospora sp. b486]MDM4784544.1 NfeD family protein [Micromonospora sp. b486]
MDAVFWIVLGVVFAVAEIFTTTLFLIMFGVGAFAAAGAAALGAPVALQAVVFAVVSALSVAVVRPVVRRHARRRWRPGSSRSGSRRWRGHGCGPGAGRRRPGMVKIGGELWTARSYDVTRTYAEGERVQVIKVRGATALVWQDDISTPGELPEAKR